MFATIWENTFVYAAIFDFFVYVLCAITMPKIADLVVAKYDRLNVMYACTLRSVAMIYRLVTVFCFGICPLFVLPVTSVCSAEPSDISSRANTIAMKRLDSDSAKFR